MSKYILTVGPPGAGKSTVLSLLRGEIVSPDIYRDTLGSTVKEAYDHARAIIPALLQEGKDVILDATNARLDARVQMINIGRPFASQTICIWLDTPFAECLARHERRLVEMRASGANIGRYVGQVEPLEVAIQKQSQSIAADPPKLSDGFDQIIRIVPY